MSRQIVRHERAKADLVQEAFYIAEDNLDVSDRFLEATESAFKQLSEMPGMGVRREYRRPELQEMRMWPVPGFRNYLIFYRATEDLLEIIRVLHNAQDIAGIFDAVDEA